MLNMESECLSPSAVIYLYYSILTLSPALKVALKLVGRLKISINQTIKIEQTTNFKKWAVTVSFKPQFIRNVYFIPLGGSTAQWDNELGLSP